MSSLVSVTGPSAPTVSRRVVEFWGIDDHGFTWKPRQADENYIGPS